MMNTKGEGYIDICIMVLVMMFCVSFILVISSSMNTKAEITYVASVLAEEVAKNGSTKGKTQELILKLEKELGYKLDVSFVCEYFDESNGYVQLGNDIEVIVKKNITLKGFLDFELPVEISSIRSSKSRVYFK